MSCQLVVISDPHIKADPDYSVYAEAKEQGFLVKTREGADFEGICWPGTAVLCALLISNQRRMYHFSLYGCLLLL